MKLTLILTLIYCFNMALGQSQNVKRLDGSSIATADVDEIIKKLMDTANVQGLCLAILNDNKTVYRKSYGFRNKIKNELLDTNTILQGASFTKSVFAYLSMLLVQEKVINLDKPLYKYLKKSIAAYEYFADLKDDDKWMLITARMCLSHTTGLPNSRYLNVRTGDFDSTGQMKIYFTPGKQYAYSGEGLRLLQMVEEEITNKTIEELAIEKIFIPIGMPRTGFIWHPDFDDNYAIGHLENGELNPKKKRTVPIAAGNLVTTITDFSKFIQYIMQGQGLTKKYRNEMLKPQIAISSKYQFPTIMDETTTENKSINLSYGLGWGLLKCKYGRAFYKEGHDDAWRNYTINFYDRGIGIIIMTNSANGELIFKELLREIIGDTFTPWKWQRYLPYNYKSECEVKH